ncbi:hypothetical protein J437_LFUL004336 [Ladona fulva]|uniref:Uncharacterized protein n=1 Tax=Ladona fulva TaxID=123851 RepID=A0A8K0K4I9_LADFU|nr:hypothetical protein J437_LFUL004336 [Ladona fulva]
MIGDALFVDLPRVRLDGGAKAFRKRWGYELCPPPPLLEEEEEEEDGVGGEEGSVEEGAHVGETMSLKEEGLGTSSPLGQKSSGKTEMGKISCTGYVEIRSKPGEHARFYIKVVY